MSSNKLTSVLLITFQLQDHAPYLNTPDAHSQASLHFDHDNTQLTDSTSKHQQEHYHAVPFAYLAVSQPWNDAHLSCAQLRQWLQSVCNGEFSEANADTGCALNFLSVLPHPFLSSSSASSPFKQGHADSRSRVLQHEEHSHTAPAGSSSSTLASTISIKELSSSGLLTPLQSTALATSRYTFLCEQAPVTPRQERHLSVTAVLSPVSPALAHSVVAALGLHSELAGCLYEIVLRVWPNSARTQDAVPISTPEFNPNLSRPLSMTSTDTHESHRLHTTRATITEPTSMIFDPATIDASLQSSPPASTVTSSSLSSSSSYTTGLLNGNFAKRRASLDFSALQRSTDERALLNMNKIEEPSHHLVDSTSSHRHGLRQPNTNDFHPSTLYPTSSSPSTVASSDVYTVHDQSTAATAAFVSPSQFDSKAPGKLRKRKREVEVGASVSNVRERSASDHKQQATRRKSIETDVDDDEEDEDEDGDEEVEEISPVEFPTALSSRRHSLQVGSGSPSMMHMPAPAALARRRSIASLLMSGIGAEGADEAPIAPLSLHSALYQTSIVPTKQQMVRDISNTADGVVADNADVVKLMVKNYHSMDDETPILKRRAAAAAVAASRVDAESEPESAECEYEIHVIGDRHSARQRQRHEAGHKQQHAIVSDAHAVTTRAQAIRQDASAKMGVSDRHVVYSDVHEFLRDERRQNSEDADAEPEPLWICVENAPASVIERIGRHYGVHPLTVEDCQARGIREKLEVFPHYLFIVFHALDQHSSSSISPSRPHSPLVEHSLTFTRPVPGRAHSGKPPLLAPSASMPSLFARSTHVRHADATRSAASTSLVADLWRLGRELLSGTNRQNAAAAAASGAAGGEFDDLVNGNTSGTLLSQCDLDLAHSTPVKVVIFPSCVLTFHEAGLKSVQRVRRQLQRMYFNRLDNTAWLVHALLDTITDSLIPVVAHTCRVADALEDDIYLPASESAQSKKALLRQMNLMGRRLAFLRQRMWSKRDILLSLIEKDWAGFLRGVRIPYLRDCYDHLETMLHRIDASVEVVDTIQATYLSMVNIEVSVAAENVNSAMKKMSAAATILLPLTLVTGIMGMNIVVPWQAAANLNDPDEYPPSASMLEPFLVLMALFAIFVVSMIWYFRQTRYLSIF